MSTAYPDPDSPVAPDPDAPATPGDDEDQGDEDDDDPALADLRSVPGLIGTLGTRELGDLARQIAEIGRSARNPFGERIIIVAGRLADLAAEARRRLAEDRLPADAGTPEQQQRRREAAGDAAIMTDGLETFG